MLSKLLTSAFAATCFSLLATAASIPNPTPHLPRGILDGTPKACQFPLGRQNDFGYWDQSDAAGRDVCFGWAQGSITCGKAWSRDEISDIMSAASQQLAKDGQWKSTTVGRWTATFATLTTAFADPNPVFFDHGIQNIQTPDSSSIGAMTWYYMDSGNFMLVETVKCPRDE